MSEFSFFIAKVVNVMDDPHKSGRVRVRIFGRHDDVGSFPDDTLPWALPIQPITSAAIGRIGTSPLGLLPGSNVIGMYADPAQQYPMLLGSLGKSGDPDGGPVQDGVISIDHNKGGSIPSYSQSSAPLDKIAYGILAAGGVAAAIALTKKLYETGKGPDPSTPNTKGTTMTDEVKSKLHNSDAPTTASVDPKDKGGVLDHITNVDPSSASATVKGAVAGLIPVAKMLSVSSPAGVRSLMQGSFLGGISSLAALAGIGPVTSMLSSALGSMGILPEGTFPDGAKAIIMGAMTGMLVASAANNGRPSAPQKPAASVPTSTSPKPPDQQIVSTPPSGYIKQYYAAGIDPWPGYIVWKNPNDFNIEVYTLRNGEPNWTSAEQEITFKHSDTAHTGLNNILAAGLTGAAAGLALATLMNSMGSSIQDMGLSSILGHGVGLGSILSMAPQLLGFLGTSVNKLVSGRLPISALSGGFATAMTGFTVSQALLAAKKSSMDGMYKKSDLDQDLEILEAALAVIALIQALNPGSSSSISIPLSNGAINTVGGNTSTTMTTVIGSNLFQNLQLIS